MRICLYSPYLPGHFGGGEKYLLDVATTLAKEHEVFIAVNAEQAAKEKQFKSEYEAFFNLSLAGITFVVSPLSKGTALEKLRWTKQFDRLYYVTDGSLFFSLAKKNILHIQFPFTHSMNGVVARTKLKSWQVKNTNSGFTKKIIEQHWQTHIGYVHYPMIKTPDITAAELDKKQHIILSVGRIFRQLHNKRHDVLIQAFQQLRSAHPKISHDWKLVIIGGIEDQAYADELHQLAGQSSIEFYHDLNREQLESWYRKASLYWHAAGYGIDDTVHPEKVEHFGISTVEAMSYGVVPLVVGKGGQLEVLGRELAQNAWQTIDECVTKTATFITSPNTLQVAQRAALQQARSFDETHFQQTLAQMIA